MVFDELKIEPADCPFVYTTTIITTTTTTTTTTTSTNTTTTTTTATPRVGGGSTLVMSIALSCLKAAVHISCMTLPSSWFQVQAPKIHTYNWSMTQTTAIEKCTLSEFSCLISFDLKRTSATCCLGIVLALVIRSCPCCSAPSRTSPPVPLSSAARTHEPHPLSWRRGNRQDHLEMPWECRSEYSDSRSDSAISCFTAPSALQETVDVPCYCYCYCNSSSIVPPSMTANFLNRNRYIKTYAVYLVLIHLANRYIKIHSVYRRSCWRNWCSSSQEPVRRIRCPLRTPVRHGCLDMHSLQDDIPEFVC